MQNLKISQDAVQRFHDALQHLKTDKKIRGVQTFANKYGINRRNLHTSKLNPVSGNFEVGWLTLLVRDYDVSARWLLTGKGDFYDQYEIVRKKLCAKPAHKDIIW